MDFATFQAAFVSANTLLNIAKNIKDADTSHQVVNAVIDLQQKLITANQVALSLQENHRYLLDQVAELTSKKELEKRVVYHHNAYWEQRAGYQAGPFCPSCWDKARDLVRPSETYFEHPEEDDTISLVCNEHDPPRYFRVPTRMYLDRK